LDHRDTNAAFRDTTALAAAPSLTAFVLWILADAVKRQIRTLYFLARDGLAMYTIAKELCRAWNLPMECRYLYCSRYALRMPLYTIDKEYATMKLCEYMFDTRLFTVLERAGITGEDADRIAKDLDVPTGRRLTRDELKALQDKLLNNAAFDKIALSKAQEALEAASGYLKQELRPSENCAIVDSGWFGTMQTCLTILTRSIYGSAEKPPMGYYFGILKEMDAQYGTYHCFLFSDAKSSARYPWFCINLYECLCAANHGMTVGYEYNGAEWTARLTELEHPSAASVWSAEKQLALYAGYAEDFAKTNFFNLPHKVSR
jgi:predicted HAD superfamily hydrolase